MCLSPRNLIIQATLKMVVKPTWCGTTLIHIITFRAFSIVFWYMMYFVTMLVNDSHGVQEHSSIPRSYKGRVKIEGRATLVIKNINPADNTKFKCELERGLRTYRSVVQLIVAGM